MAVRRYMPEMQGIRELEEQENLLPSSQLQQPGSSSPSNASTASAAWSPASAACRTPASAARDPVTPLSAASPNPFSRSRHRISQFPGLEAWLAARAPGSDDDEEEELGDAHSRTSTGSAPFRWSVDQLSNLVQEHEEEEEEER